MNQAKRTCLFCGSTETLTREHVWPRWLEKVLPGTGVKPSHVYSEEGRPTREFVAPDYSIQVRVVCGSCNHGWMADLENQARPVLTPMITASDAVTLDAASQRLLLAWVLKTGMMMEQAQTGMATIPSAHHRFMGEHHVAPARVQAWVGARASGVGLTRYDHQGIGASGAHESRDGYGIMLGLGGMCAFLLSLPDMGSGPLARPEVLLDPEDDLAYAIRRIAPTRDDAMPHPASQFLHDRDLDDLQAGLTGREDLPLADRMEEEAWIRVADRRLWFRPGEE